jgi:hypothetical protein
MAVREDVGLDLDRLPHDALDREAAAVDLRADGLDDGARRGLGLGGRLMQA